MGELTHQEAVDRGAAHCGAPAQRSVVILKDVLDEQLIEIAALLTPRSAGRAIWRGVARLREINAQAGPLPDARPASAAVARYVALFNQRDWDSLQALQPTM